MTDEELQEHIAAIEKANAQGLIEECGVTGDWKAPVGGSVCLSSQFKYRIKPKPREVYVDLKNGRSYPVDEMSIYDYSVYPKFREVL